MRLMKRLARYTFATDMLGDFVSKAVTPDDIQATKAAGKHCLYLTGNGVPLTQQWESIPDELRYLRVFYQLGIRMMHLTYQRRNMIDRLLYGINFLSFCSNVFHFSRIFLCSALLSTI